MYGAVLCCRITHVADKYFGIGFQEPFPPLLYAIPPGFPGNQIPKGALVEYATTPFDASFGTSADTSFDTPFTMPRDTSFEQTSPNTKKKTRKHDIGKLVLGGLLLDFRQLPHPKGDEIVRRIILRTPFAILLYRN